MLDLMSERQTISRHEAITYTAVSGADHWLTNHEIAEAVKDLDVSLRTVRLHTRRLTDLGIFDEAMTSPNRSYRMAAQPNPTYLGRITDALSTLGIRSARPSREAVYPGDMSNARVAQLALEIAHEDHPLETLTRRYRDCDPKSVAALRDAMHRFGLTWAR
jgi:hypothetical protein